MQGNSESNGTGILVLVILLGNVYLGLNCVLNPKDSFLVMCLLSSMQLSGIATILLTRQFSFLYFFLTGQFLFYCSSLWVNYFLTSNVPIDRHQEMVEMIVCNLIIFVTFFMASGLALGFQKVEFKTPKMEGGRKAFLFGFLFLYEAGKEFVPPVVAKPIDSFFSVGIILALAYTGGTRSMNFLLRILLLGLLGVQALNSGFLSQIFLIGLAAFLIAVIQRSWKVATLLGVISISFYFIQPLKGEYRRLTWGVEGLDFWDRIEVARSVYSSVYGDGNLNDAEKMTGGFESSIDTIRQLAGDGSEVPESVIQALVSSSAERMGDDSLKRVLEKSGVDVPFYGGATYENLLFNFIPRFLWPDKPTWKLGGLFGHDFGYLGDDDQVTSIAFNFLAEGYMNFGFLGLYIIAALYGILMAFFDYLSKRLWGDSYLPAFVSIGVIFLNYNSDMLGLIQTAILTTGAAFLYKFVVIPRGQINS